MDSTVFVRFNEQQGGLLFDISEGGLAFDGITPKNRNAPIHLNFHLPQTNTTFEARARMVWVDRWNHRIGVRFIDLPESSRRRLRGWLSTSVVSHTGRSQPEAPAPVAEQRLHVVPSLLTNTAFPQAAPAEIRKPRRFDGLFWGLVFLSTTLFLLALFMSRSQQPSEAHQAAPVNAPSAAGSESAPSLPAPQASSTIQSPVVSTSPSPSPSPAAPAASNWQMPRLPATSGNFILQVGAMSEESHAVELSADLARKNFQAFVRKRPGDRFFRVDVGPYSDEAAALAVQHQLETQGFSAILKSQPPR